MSTQNKREFYSEKVSIEGKHFCTQSLSLVYSQNIESQNCKRICREK